MELKKKNDEEVLVKLEDSKRGQDWSWGYRGKKHHLKRKSKSERKTKTSHLSTSNWQNPKGNQLVAKSLRDTDYPRMGEERGTG